MSASVFFEPGWAPDAQGVYRLSRYAAARVARGKLPKNRRPVQWNVGSVSKVEHLGRIESQPEMQAACPRCHSINTIELAALPLPSVPAAEMLPIPMILAHVILQRGGLANVCAVLDEVDDEMERRAVRSLLDWRIVVQGNGGPWAYLWIRDGGCWRLWTGPESAIDSASSAMAQSD